MGVAPNRVINQKHYGSTYSMADYTTNAHSVFMSATFTPSDRARLFSTISYVQSTASLDAVVMPDVTEQLEGDLTHQDFTFPEMDTYSDLDYSLIRLSLGFEYRLAPSVVWTADGVYADLSDDAAYVYGNESGSELLVRSGFRFDF